MKEININNKLRLVFIDEATKLLDDFEKDLLEYEHSPRKEVSEAIFRAVHTLKGVSGMFGFCNISELTHDLENIYDGIRNNKITLSKEIFEVSFSFIDHTRKLLNDQDSDDETIKNNHKILRDIILDICRKTCGDVDILKHAEEKKAEKKKLRTWYILFRTDEQLLQRSVNLLYIFQDLAGIGRYEIGDIRNDAVTLQEEGVDYWAFYFVTEASIQELEEVFIFISDNVKLTKIADFDIFKDGREGDQLPGSAPNMELSVSDVVEQRARHLEETVKTENNGNKSAPVLNKKEHISHISVSSDKLDRLMYLVSELVTTKSELLLSINNNNSTKALEAAKKIESLSKHFHDNAINIRLVPINEMVLRFKRLIRDLSIKMEKKVELSVQGEDTELDKNVIDIITEPLMHIIRNCIDHGIETPHKRASKGKKETGTINLNAYQGGSEIYIEISDDGSGIDPELIRTKAIEKGVISPEAKLSLKELYDLIFLPGFSTAQSLTEVSGRGVGMDVVRRKIQDLHGEVEVISQIGVGTTFRIKLHQTIAILETLLIQVDNRYFAIPLPEIESCTQQVSNDLYQDNNRRFVYQNDLVPFISLREIFHIHTSPPAKEKLLIIRKHDSRYAVTADRIIGEYQAVIKPLGKLLKAQKYITGASILGDGNLAMILDTNQLKICSEKSIMKQSQEPRTKSED